MNTKDTTDWITAIGTAISALASVVLFLVALVQLRGLREQLKQSSEQERRRNTLEVIRRDENDPALQEAYKTIMALRIGRTDYSKTTECEFQVTNLLNYFEGIAIGITQNIYVEEMVKDNLKESLGKAVRIWLTAEPVDGLKVPPAMFEHTAYPSLRNLYARWFPVQEVTYKAEVL